MQTWPGCDGDAVASRGIRGQCVVDGLGREALVGWREMWAWWKVFRLCEDTDRVCVGGAASDRDDQVQWGADQEREGWTRCGGDGLDARGRAERCKCERIGLSVLVKGFPSHQNFRVSSQH